MTLPLLLLPRLLLFCRPLDKGFRTAPLIRFIGKEDGLLSHTGDGHRVIFSPHTA
jgi:hypothetical protein